MPQSFLRYNDGSQNAPRLRVEHSLWSLIKLPMNAEIEWSLDEKFRRVKESGFEGVEITVGDAENTELMDAFKAHGLNRVLLVQAADTEAALKQIKRAVEVGTDFLWVQPGNAFTPPDAVVEMIAEATKMASDHGLCLFVETHRNNFTENLPQCLALIERAPEVRFTADLSHLILIGEFYGWEDERAIDRLMPILERTSHLHGRISNGEQVQVDVGDGSGQTAQFFVELWAEAMRHWLKGAGPGDVFPFASELGPPRYAITLPDGSEFSDRWEQSLVMKKLAEQAWAKAQSR
jgi:sugar phosphate isomerase/epimerase